MAPSISSWAQGIIVAILAGAIIQMLLPENKSQKYIKVVIGIYILFCIISPVIGKEIDLNEFNVDKYLNVEVSRSNEESNIYDSNVKEMFKSKVIYNIKSQLNSKGYESNNIEVDIDDKCTILKIRIANIYENEGKNKNDNKENIEHTTVVINKIETNVIASDTNIKEKKASGMAISDKNSLIDYLSENYQIDKKNIVIE